ncbi:hypothetical protein Nepgr_000602 [Nepenthes gracilis]|uniref:U-box domain-containing protein n=1 Tax=Nepenthes gracilis TaxID=150966 RepID=A0AAD3P5K4_NEPGR|nr:hypothetical protein Nepgr_000602 [Nepenthes gracilis]
MADEIDQCKQKKPNQFVEIAEKLIHGGLLSQVQAARDIRRLVRSCSSSASAARSRTKFVAAGVIQPLISMLAYSNLDAREAALIALLNLAVRNERNKVKMVASGVIPPLLKLLQSRNSKLPELATAAILTLSAAAPNKLIIAASGAAPLLVQILSCGSIQGQVDAVTALYNLTTCTENSSPILDAIAVPPLISLLKECKKYSKFAGKATALLEILSNSEEGRIAITNSSGGILTLVETVEDGSLVSTEHAVGALLSLCRSCRSKYRELILQEGAIPGLLRLTVDGTVKAQEGARMLLDLLRDSPRERRIASSVLERIAYDIALRVDGPDKAAETAKKLLQDMVHTSMDASVNCIQLRAAPSIPSEMPSL